MVRVGWMTGTRESARNRLEGSVAVAARMGRSAPWEGAHGVEAAYRASVLASHRFTAAIGDACVVAELRVTSVGIPRVCAPAGRPVIAREAATAKGAAPRPVDPVIIALVPLAAAGDEPAFTRLVEAFHPDMARLAFVVCGGQRELAEDAVQSAWAIAWSRLGTLREPERIRAWLLSVTANEARQFLRRERRPTFGLEFAEERVAAPDPYPSVAALDVAGALARLRPEERVLVGLRYAAGLDSAEIGAVLGMSASGVRSRLDRLLDRLRAELDT